MDTVHNIVKCKTITPCHTFDTAVNCFIILRLMKGTHNVQHYHSQILHFHFCLHLSRMFFKLRLGALIPRFVGYSVCMSVVPLKITKKLQNFTKHNKMGQILGLLVAPNNFDYNFRASRTYSMRKVDNRKN